MSKNQGFASVALIIIALLVLGGGYWVWKDKAEAPAPVDTSIEPTPPVPPTPASPAGGPSVDTVDWKTYRNDEYGFEFKYPPYLSPESIGQKITAVNLGDYDNPVYGISVGKGANFILIDTALLRDGVKKVIDFSSPTGTNQVVNKNSLLINYVDFTENGEPPIYYAFVDGTSSDLFVEFYPRQRGGLKDVDDVNKLLSTFRFVDSGLNTLNTYRSNKYGFEFNYPARLSFLESTTIPGCILRTAFEELKEIEDAPTNIILCISKSLAEVRDNLGSQLQWHSSMLGGKPSLEGKFSSSAYTVLLVELGNGEGLRIDNPVPLPNFDIVNIIKNSFRFTK